LISRVAKFSSQGLLHTFSFKISGPHTFQRYETWVKPGLQPSPAEALKLLHRLAADKGIQYVMSQHRFAQFLLPRRLLLQLECSDLSLEAFENQYSMTCAGGLLDHSQRCPQKVSASDSQIWRVTVIAMA
jgi:hypothetical protein